MMRGLTIRLSIAIALLGCLHSARAVDPQKSRFWFPWRCKTPETFPKSQFYGYYPTCWKPWRLNCPDCETCCPPGYGQQPYDGMVVEGAAAENVPPGTTAPETLPPGSVPTRPGEGTFPPVEPLFPNAPPLRMPTDAPGATGGEAPNSPDERPTDLPPTTGDENFERRPTDAPTAPEAEPGALPADEPSATRDLLPDAPESEPSESGTVPLAPPTAPPSSPNGDRASSGSANRSRVERTARAPALRAPSLRAPANKPAAPTPPSPEVSPSPSLEALQQTLDQSQRAAAAPKLPLAVKPYSPPEGVDLPPASPWNDPAPHNAAAAVEATTVARRAPVTSPATPAVARPARQVAAPSAYVAAARAPAASASGGSSSPRSIVAPTVAAPQVVAPQVARPARAPRKTSSPVVQAAAALNETALADPAELVRLASAATVPPQSPAAARAGRRPQVPVVECARPVYQTAQAIGAAGPSNQATAAGYHAPVATPGSTSSKTHSVAPSRDQKALRSLIAPPMKIAPRTSVVEPIGVFVPAGK